MAAPEDVIRALNERRTSGLPLQSILGELPFDGPVLGQGGTAIVFPIRFGGGPAVAKFLVDPGSLRRAQRFQFEFQKLVAIRHPNIVALYHYERVEIAAGVSLPMIVMERCVSTLKRSIRNLADADQRVELVRRVSGDVLPALATLHDAGIIHRDLKPANVLVRDDGSLVLADFGIAKFDLDRHPDVAGLTETDDRLANRGYSAPEQESGGAITPSADLFAFGQVLHAVIFGQPLLGTTARPPSAVHPLLGPWDTLLRRLLDMDATRRTQSVGELSDALREADLHARELRDAAAGVDALHRFEHMVARIIPGQRGLVEVRDQSEIERALGLIHTEFDALDLWWTRGQTDNRIDEAPRPLGDGLWLIDRFEMRPTAMWVYQPGHGVSRHFIVIKNEGRPGFFGEAPAELSDRSEAGWFQGRYVTRRESDDGYARIDGNVVALDGVELRARDHIPRCYVLVPRMNVLLGAESDRDTGPALVETITKNLEADGKLRDEDLRAVQRIPRRLAVAMLD